MSQEISLVKINTSMRFSPVKSKAVILSAVVAKLELFENNKITSRLPNNVKEFDLPMVVFALKILLDLKYSIINLSYKKWMLVLPEVTVTQSNDVAIKYNCHIII